MAFNEWSTAMKENQCKDAEAQTHKEGQENLASSRPWAFAFHEIGGEKREVRSHRRPGPPVCRPHDVPFRLLRSPLMGGGTADQDVPPAFRTRKRGVGEKCGLAQAATPSQFTLSCPKDGGQPACLTHHQGQALPNGARSPPRCPAGDARPGRQPYEAASYPGNGAKTKIPNRVQSFPRCPGVQECPPQVHCT